MRIRKSMLPAEGNNTKTITSPMKRILFGILIAAILQSSEALNTRLFHHSIRHHAPSTIPSRRAYVGFADSTLQRRNAPLLTKSNDHLEEKNVEFSSRRKRDWVRGKVRTYRGKMQRWMEHILQWKNRKGKTMLAAAAFALSIFFCSQQQLDQYATSPSSSSSSMMSSPNAEINLVQRNNAMDHPAEYMRGGGRIAERGGGGGREEVAAIVRGGGGKAAVKKSAQIEEAVVSAAESTAGTFQEAIVSLRDYMAGPKSDTLILLLATALITPFCQRLGTSPILGFLASGMLLGPNGFGLISGIHTTETLAELGIVFFLFEMGIELSVERLMSMKRDVFGLGLSQFLCSALAIAGVGKFAGLPPPALVVLGGGIALSSSAFVLQLLKDKNQLATRFGKAAFGVLLFQDLAVVPLLVVTPILAGGGGGLAQALGSAVLKAGMALGGIFLAGRYLLNPMFRTVAQSQSQESFLGLILLTVLSMSFMTEGLGLSNTLGAFLAGVLLSETKYKYQVEADIAPFRGVLLGLFFVTVGFEIDLALIAGNLPLVSSVVVGILAIKALITTLLSLAFGLSLSVSQQTGLLLSQGGEFAFVAFGLARSLGILDPPTTKLLLTSVSLTMAVTPALASAGGKIAKSLEEKSDFTHYLGQDREANEIKESEDFAVVVGYGAVGKVVCDLMDRKLIKYVGIELDPNRAIQARNAGLPVFYGDIARQEVAEAFNVGKARAVIVCISDQQDTNRAVIALRRFFPDLKIFCRARNKDHAYRLQTTLDVAAMVPILPEDNLLLTLPFGGAVLKAMGAPPEEVNAILESKRKEVMSGKSLEETEEDMALVQLGIEPESKKKVLPPVNATSTVESVAVDQDEEGEFDELTAAAADRYEQSKEKNPFVAQVISEACPESAEDKPAVSLDEEILDVEILEAEDMAAVSPAILVEEIVVTAGANDTSMDPADQAIADQLVDSLNGVPTSSSSPPKDEE